MHLTSMLIGLLIAGLAIELPTPTAAQFWKRVDTAPSWHRELLAERPSGICYKTLSVDTVNPNSRNRQISYCCDGYVNKGTSQILKCEPICLEDCSNGVCLAPGNCQCGPGYSRERKRCRLTYDED
ncbi:nephronectin [Drosophila ficusphila]|uniref:nephronectin n=1 Tax=Drosophila ficusphila TaxID=30025 RepID=UPI0007E60941|nr:nephronectin [Drosophila ficusphila]